MDTDSAPPAERPYAKPLPKITALNRGFWDHARGSVLALQVCDACGDVHLPEAPVCPKCLGSKQSWRPASGRGTLESWADFHRSYWDGFKDGLPYRVCLVRLAEGPLIISSLVGDRAPEAIGTPLRVVFEKVTEEISLPKFVVA